MGLNGRSQVVRPAGRLTLQHGSNQPATAPNASLLSSAAEQLNCHTIAICYPPQVHHAVAHRHAGPVPGARLHHTQRCQNAKQCGMYLPACSYGPAKPTLRWAWGWSTRPATHHSLIITPFSSLLSHHSFLITSHRSLPGSQIWRLCFFIAGLPIIWWIGRGTMNIAVWGVERTMFTWQNAVS